MNKTQETIHSKLPALLAGSRQGGLPRLPLAPEYPERHGVPRNALFEGNSA